MNLRLPTLPELFLVGVLVIIGVIYSMMTTSQSLPPYVNTMTIEKSYGSLVTRLKDMAERGVVAPDLPGDQNLVAPKEILQAQANTIVLGGKKVEVKENRYVMPRPLTSGMAVVNRYWYTLADGRKLDVVAYEARWTDAAGKQLDLLIIFDRELLEEKLRPAQPG